MGVSCRGRSSCWGVLQRHRGNDAHRGDQEAHHPPPEGPAAVGLTAATVVTAVVGILGLMEERQQAEISRYLHVLFPGSVLYLRGSRDCRLRFYFLEHV